MAYIYFEKFETLDDDGNIILRHYENTGAGGGQVAVSYEVSRDPEFKDIVWSTYFNQNPKYFESIHTRLPDPKTGKAMKNEKMLYARGRVFCGRIPTDFMLPEPELRSDKLVLDACDATRGMISYSPWSDAGCDTQLEQELVITEEGEEDIHVNSKDINFDFTSKLGD